MHSDQYAKFHGFAPGSVEAKLIQHLRFDHHCRYASDYSLERVGEGSFAVRPGAQGAFGVPLVLSHAKSRGGSFDLELLSEEIEPGTSAPPAPKWEVIDP